MLDHVSIGVSHFGRSRIFYDAVLTSLGYGRVWTVKDAAGYGYDGQDEFFAIRLHSGAVPVPADQCHYAFKAGDREAVDRFYDAAMALGAVDEGATGLNPEYDDNYYAAFVRDPDGYRIEAVHHG